MLLETEDKVHLGVEKSVLLLDGILWVPVAELMEAVGKQVSVRDEVVYIADKKCDMTKGMAKRIQKVLGK